MTKADVVLLGQVLSFAGDPFTDGIDAAHIERSGAVAIGAGKIIAHGPAQAIRAAPPLARVVDYGSDLF
jgi:guanine deaminase